jgi:putative transposase
LIRRPPASSTIRDYVSLNVGATWVLDPIAGGRVLEILTSVDDATHECVAAMPEHAIGGQRLVRIFIQLELERRLPRIIRPDNGKESIGKAMLNGSYGNGIELWQIEPGKLNQNAYIESFNGRFCDECLNEHWFTSLEHARRSSKLSVENSTRSVPRKGWAD